MALLGESMDRRLDEAFEVQRSEAEYNERLSQRIFRLEKQLEKLGEAYAIEDTIRQERDLFLTQLQELGADPWELPGNQL